MTDRQAFMDMLSRAGVEFDANPGDKFEVMVMDDDGAAVFFEFADGSSLSRVVMMFD